ncbi:MAG: hypothetical protein GY705_05570 [Bacteroidetes bacterium]|nr:hypothetical protein [Bacteroidota bacterium]
MKISYSVSLIITAFFLLNISCGKDRSKTILNILNNEWRAIELSHPEVQSLPPNMYILRFEKDYFHIRLDVNSCEGEIEKVENRNTIKVNRCGCTLACCDSEFSMQMIRFFREESEVIYTGKYLLLEKEGNYVKFEKM